MSEHSDQSIKLFNEGCNCCQAVVASRAGEFGVDDATAMAMGAAFGGGMRRGEVCGAVVGGLMLVGLKYGAKTAADQDQKAVANGKTIEFMDAFKAKYGSYLCRELIKNAGGKKICPVVIAGAEELFEEMAAKG